MTDIYMENLLLRSRIRLLTSRVKFAEYRIDELVASLEKMLADMQDGAGKNICQRKIEHIAARAMRIQTLMDRIDKGDEGDKGES